jgi:hypothetical protein
MPMMRAALAATHPVTVMTGLTQTPSLHFPRRLALVLVGAALASRDHSRSQAAAEGHPLGHTARHRQVRPTNLAGSGYLSS